ncbi:MAG: hypothetical protein Q7T08_03425 [Devosia sp.]|nr:hypothetical protein [Devosia sp.]
MRKRDWSAVTAFGIVAVVCFGFAIGLWAGRYYKGGDEAQQQPSDEQDTGAADLSALAGSPKRYETICAKPADHDDADLCQQWRSAEQAAQSAGYAQAQFYLGLGGLAGLGVTLFYAIRTFRLQDRTSRAELRAYISLIPDHCSSFDETTFCIMSVKVQNDGSTPALNLRHSSRVILIHNVEGNPKAPGPNVEPDRDTAAGLASLHRGQSVFHHRTADRPFTKDEIALIGAGKSAVAIVVEATYEDVFGNDHVEKIGSFLKADEETLAKLTNNYLGRDLSVSFARIPNYGEST